MTSNTGDSTRLDPTPQVDGNKESKNSHRNATRISGDPVPALREGPADELASRGLAAKRYNLRQKLGQGGMATVYLAFDQVLLREVALKQLHPHLLSSIDLARFVTEAQITGQLDHPNIVPVYDLVVGDSPHFVMKLLGGKSLSEHLFEHPAPRDSDTLNDLLEVFLKVCDALAFAHSRGVIHRDLKPRNIMVGTFGRVYVVDWGLARIIRDWNADCVNVTHALDIRDDGSGTAAYMAPEQARPGWRAIGPWTDTFALGAILYEILTGKPPHQGGTAEELRERAFQGHIVPPERASQGSIIPPLLSRVAMVATAREPQHRFGSVEELRHEVERFWRGGVKPTTRLLQPGETLVRKGELVSVAHVILRGRCSTLAEGSREPRTLGQGSVLHADAVLAPLRAPDTVVALDTCAVQLIDQHALDARAELDGWGAFTRAALKRRLDPQP